VHARRDDHARALLASRREHRSASGFRWSFGKSSSKTKSTCCSSVSGGKTSRRGLAGPDGTSVVYEELPVIAVNCWRSSYNPKHSMTVADFIAK
jgi:hypothetical protein